MASAKTSNDEDEEDEEDGEIDPVCCNDGNNDNPCPKHDRMQDKFGNTIYCTQTGLPMHSECCSKIVMSGYNPILCHQHASVRIARRGGEQLPVKIKSSVKRKQDPPAKGN